MIVSFSRRVRYLKSRVSLLPASLLLSANTELSPRAEPTALRSHFTKEPKLPGVVPHDCRGTPDLRGWVGGGGGNNSKLIIEKVSRNNQAAVSIFHSAPT